MVEPAIIAPVVSCFVGFGSSVDGSRCIKTPGYRTTAEPPRCVDPFGGQSGQIAANGRQCTLPPIPRVDPSGNNFAVLVDANVEPVTTGVTPRAIAVCPVGYELIAGDLCESSVNVPGATHGAFRDEISPLYVCERGELVGESCAVVIDDTSGLPVFVAGTDSSAATCNGFPVAFDAAAQCVASGESLIYVPAAVAQRPAGASCAVGYELVDGVTTCALPSGTQPVRIPATELVPPGEVSCPDGFVGPSSETLVCLESFDGPSLGSSCTTGRLQAERTATSFLPGVAEPITNVVPVACVLDHLPEPPTPIIEPVCAFSVYEPASNECVAEPFNIACELGRITTVAGCEITAVAAACLEGTLLDVNGEAAIQSICRLDTTLGDEPWTVESSSMECPVGTLDAAAQLCMAPAVSVALPSTCAGYEVTVDLNQGDQPTDGDDVILGTTGPDIIAAGAGNDVVCGLHGDDVIWGQDGDDLILGGEGNDRLSGGRGDDAVAGHAGSDDLKGGRGNDAVWGGDGDDVAVRGGTGNDVVSGGAGDDALVAGNGGIDVVDGAGGIDKVTGGPRGDLLNGGSGPGEVKGNGGNDRIYGSDGASLLGGPGRDILIALGADVSCNGGNTAVEPGEPSVEYDWAQDCATEVLIP